MAAAAVSGADRGLESLWSSSAVDVFFEIQPSMKIHFNHLDLAPRTLGCISNIVPEAASRYTEREAHTTVTVHRDNMTVYNHFETVWDKPWLS